MRLLIFKWIFRWFLQGVDQHTAFQIDAQGSTWYVDVGLAPIGGASPSYYNKLK
jgi:hypothetical protein